MGGFFVGLGGRGVVWISFAERWVGKTRQVIFFAKVLSV